LLPAGATELVVCGYPTTAAGARVLDRSVSVHGGFADMASTLGNEAAAQATWCPDTTGADDYLVRAVYADGSTVWVAATSGTDCAGATNGVFTSAGGFASHLPGVLDASGTWGGSYPGDCAVVDARPGRDAAMVPAGATEGFVCVSEPRPGQAEHVHVTSDATVGHLSSLLNGPAATSGEQSCPDASGPAYVVKFRYPGGEDVTVQVVPDCETGAANGQLVSTPSQSLVDELDHLTG
jgi:hypothetical protein